MIMGLLPFFHECSGENPSLLVIYRFLEEHTDSDTLNNGFTNDTVEENNGGK